MENIWGTDIFIIFFRSFWGVMDILGELKAKEYLELSLKNKSDTDQQKVIYVILRKSFKVC